MQALDAALAIVPKGHSVHSSAPAGANEPGGHAKYNPGVDSAFQ